MKDRIPLPDFLRDAINLSAERAKLCEFNPACPDCGTRQVQLLDVGEQGWKCRRCKYIFFTDYEV